jgi:tetratricopeptide (TPR) repeat protein
MLAAVPGCSRNANELMASAKKYIEARKYSEAVIELKNAIKAAPQSFEAYYQLGIAYAGLGQLSEAGQAFAKAVALNPDHIQGQLRYGNLLLLQRKFDEARAKAELVLLRDPSNTFAEILLGNSYAGMIQLNTSIQELKTAFEVEPRLLPPYLDLSTTASFHSQPELAEQTYKKALSRAPRSVELHLALANLSLRAQRMAEAEQEYNAALAIDPTSTDVMQALAFLYMQNRQLDRAEGIYKRLAEADPARLANRIVLADFYAATDQRGRSIEVLRKTVEENKKYTIATKRLADLYLTERNFEEAARLADDVLRRNGSDFEARLIKGRIFLEQNKPVDAIADLQKVVKTRPAFSLGRYYLGLAYAQARESQKAEAEFVTAVQNDETFLLPYIPLAELKLNQGSSEAAIRYARKALADVSLSQAHLILSRAYINQRAFENAAQEVEAYLKQHPGSASGLYHLALLRLAQKDLAGAEAVLNNALKIDPENRDLVSLMARIQIQLNRPERAVDTVRQAIARSPGNADLYRALAETYWAERDYPKAEAAFLKAGSLKPEAKTALSDFYVATGQPAKAIAVDESRLMSDGPNAALQRRLAGLYLAQKSVDRAAPMIEELLKADGKDVEAHILKGRLLLAEGRTSDAVTELQAAVNIDPNSAAARTYLGNAYRQAGKTAEAESAWNEALRIDNSMVQARLALAQSNLRSGKAAEAMTQANEILKIDPSFADALLVLGNAQMLKKDFKAAEKSFQRLVDQRSGNAAALERLGAAVAAQGDFVRAESHFVEALRNDPDNIELIAALLTNDLRQKKPEKAIQHIQSYIAGHPGEAKAYELLGQVYLSRKDYSNAEASYRKALALNSNNLEAYTLLGQLFLAQNALDRAISEFNNALKVDPKSVQAHIILGMIHEMKNDSSTAQLHYREALKVDPEAAVAANNLAWLLADSGSDLKEAATLARVAVRKLPDLPNVTDTMGWIYYKTGAYSSAVDLLMRTVERAPQNPLYHYHLGMSYYKLGNIDKARTYLKSAIKLDPGFNNADDAKKTLANIAQQ